MLPFFSLLSNLIWTLAILPSITGQDEQLDVSTPAIPAGSCETITDVSLCLHVSWENASFPNLRGHSTQVEANQELSDFLPLVMRQCSNAIVQFLCSVYAPFCTNQEVQDLVLKPCRGVCEYVRAGCEPVLMEYGLPWPEHLNCTNFPSVQDATGSPESLCFNINVNSVSIPTEIVPAPSSTVVIPPSSTNSITQPTPMPINGTLKHFRGIRSHIICKMSAKVLTKKPAASNPIDCLQDYCLLTSMCLHDNYGYQ